MGTSFFEPEGRRRCSDDRKRALKTEPLSDGVQKGNDAGGNAVVPDLTAGTTASLGPAASPGNSTINIVKYNKQYERILGNQLSTTHE